MQKTCGFTGYRPGKLPFHTNEKHPACIHLKSLLYNEVEAAVKDGYTHFISGFALGSDTFFTEVVLDLRKQFPNITLEAALACENQSNNWLEKDRVRFFNLLSQCDKETYISYRYYKNCYLDRNRYILSNSQLLIAVFDGKLGGTMYTVNRAKAKQLNLVIINPSTFQIERKTQ